MDREDAARRMTLTLLAARAPDATICPSEVARALSPDHWRDEMLRVHAATDLLAEQGAVQLSWKGTPMPVRSGPYRIALSRP
ncbi:DUF3253 domain-containing protein [Sphingomonas turrisvirgatae]|uniref:S-adenosylmethionine tRNA ribosyltransferase n=1 Tax=Sphingomonas turrisvirgatae TaxID=1888892 RepID=A0A1E3LVT8_9SPHN|nr:DUF3253 domain-containing protein [Sphingomonas turrisvirgatae]ODP37897.1 hypothetical protein BFL28_16555 [Sphingomonas turrisvirgatae]